MFPQKKIFKTLVNRDYTASSLAKELVELKAKNFDEVSYVGFNLNMDMLLSRNIRNDDYKLIETQEGLAHKTYDLWHKDLVLAIDIFNALVTYTSKYYDTFLKASHEWEKEHKQDVHSKAFKDYFEQGNPMYFHDVLHTVFDVSRRLDLSIDNFKEAITFDNEDLSDYPLPEKNTFAK